MAKIGHESIFGDIGEKASNESVANSYMSQSVDRKLNLSMGNGSDQENLLESFYHAYDKLSAANDHKLTLVQQNDLSKSFIKCYENAINLQSASDYLVNNVEQFKERCSELKPDTPIKYDRGIDFR